MGFTTASVPAAQLLKQAKPDLEASEDAWDVALACRYLYPVKTCLTKGILLSTN